MKFEGTRRELYTKFLYRPHDKEVSQVLCIDKQYHDQTKIAAIICYLRFLNRDHIVIQWKEADSNRQVIEEFCMWDE